MGYYANTVGKYSSLNEVKKYIEDKGAFNPNSTLIPWNRSNGITSAISLPRNTSSPIGGLGSFFLLDSKMNINSNADMVLIGRLGASGSSSRAETLSLIDDILSFGSSLNKKDIGSDLTIDELIESSSIASYLDLKTRDVKTLFRLFDENLPLIIKSHRASDILNLISLKKKYDLNLIIMGAQEASLVIDDIAKNGVVFSEGYVSYPVCGPSRAGLITGRYQDTFGFGKNPLFTPKDPNMGLPLSEQTIADMLKLSNYKTFAVGKWHLGAHESLRPMKRGFDEFFGFLTGGHRYFPHEWDLEDETKVKSQGGAYRTKLLRNEQRIEEKEYLTDALSRESVNFIERNAKYAKIDI